jgi:hypothetical protein
MEDTILLMADLKRHKGSLSGVFILHGVGNGSFYMDELRTLSQGRNGAGGVWDPDCMGLQCA